jgi:hypothetical protein
MTDNADQIKDSNEIAEFKPEWYVNASEEEKGYFREWLLGLLKERDVVVTFKKSDGSMREMNCTLKEDIIPKVENPKTSDSLCTVWDNDISSWRSFKFENVTDVKFKIG